MTTGSLIAGIALLLLAGGTLVGVVFQNEKTVETCPPPPPMKTGGGFVPGECPSGDVGLGLFALVFFLISLGVVLAVDP